MFEQGLQTLDARPFFSVRTQPEHLTENNVTPGGPSLPCMLLFRIGPRTPNIRVACIEITLFRTT